MIELRDLQIFYWIVKLGGFRRSARHLNTTQPAVSARMAQIEASYGVRLIKRDRRQPLSLTPKGMELYIHAERMLQLRDEMLEALTDPAAFTDAVRLGVSETIVHTWLSILVQRLRQTYPGITVDISVDVSAVLHDALARGELDVALMLGPVALPQIRNLTLCEYGLAWVAAPGLDAGAEPLDLAALSRWPILTYSRQTKPYQEIQQLFANSSIPARLFGNASIASIIKLTRDEIGIGAIAPVAVADELKKGTLRLLESKVVLPRLHFTASFIEGPGNIFASAIAYLRIHPVKAACGH